MLRGIWLSIAVFTTIYCVTQGFALGAAIWGCNIGQVIGDMLADLRDR